MSRIRQSRKVPYRSGRTAYLIPGVYLPVIGCAEAQPADRRARARAGIDPRTITGVVIAGVVAILVVGGSGAGLPRESESERLIDRCIGWAGLTERGRGKAGLGRGRLRLAWNRKA